ncbi:hypothetical protein [Pseudomonas alkylphenolica]|uniref:Uncharacterized protein n=1 Tax=Pseudomonas alkylphenolica TaxID=237609 RepID=A0A077FIP2_9PSED|nr:hypothetical protein [Pseudomonas alkylphenolica]AIL63096.1 hypothetical protein PSAKL28_39480 [Pseudomonas alkylphenolica]
MPVPSLSQSLMVNLDYYDGHQSLLAKGAYETLGTASKVESFQKQGKIPLSDFLNYFLIHRSVSPDYASYIERLNYLDTASTWLNGVLDLNGSINWRPGSKGLQENVGEAVSLSVASSLFGLTAADWETIPEQKGTRAHPTFDFERTLVGITAQNAVVQIEAKGSFVRDNTVDQSAVKAHARNISKKKSKITNIGAAYKHPATAMYGMIVSIDPTNEAKCADSTPSGHPVRSHLARHSRAIWPPVPRPSGRAVGAQRRRGGIVSPGWLASSISASVCALIHPSD